MRRNLCKLFIILLFCFFFIACKEKKPNIPIEKPTFEIEENISLMLGTSHEFKFDRSIILSTEDTSIVSVNSEKQTIDALSIGEAKVTISYKYYPEITKELTIVVNDPNNISLKVGESYTFEDEAIEEVISDNFDILESDGCTITAVNPGESLVIIIFNTGEEKEITITITE